MKAPLRLAQTRRPITYELDARSWLARLSGRYGRRIHLGDVPPEALDPILATGCDLLWLEGVWRTGPISRRVARDRPGLEPATRAILPEFTPGDIAGSPYAIAAYEVAPALGGEDGLAQFRGQIARAGVGLVLDYVPNHTGLDHPWIHRHPDWYVNAGPSHDDPDPSGWFNVRADGRTHHLAHGRDPQFPAWPDTAQLDYRVPDLRAAMTDLLRQVASRCDGVRCDMAMLVLEDVFCATWQASSPTPRAGDAPAGEFWWHAIRSVREQTPHFVMIAEAYWDLGYRLQQLGFDYTYDKVLLDRLRNGSGEDVAAHLRADAEYQRRSVRFIENHDEPRAAATLSPGRQRSAAFVVATIPGMLLLHDGQLEGARVHTPIELGRRPEEPPDEGLRTFYRGLLDAVGGRAFRLGTPVRLEPRSTWEGDPTHGGFLAWLWVGPGRELRLAVVNLGPSTGRCFVPFGVPGFAGRTIVFEDLLSDARYERDGQDLLDRGLYLELAPDGHHLFRIVGHRTSDGGRAT